MKKIILVLLLLASAVGAWCYWSLDGLRNIDPKQSMACSPINGAGSAQDIAIDYGTRIAFLSVYDRLGHLQGDNRGNGSIVSLDLKRPNTSYLAKEMAGLTDFRPAGLSLFQRDSGQRRLYVVNNRSTGQDTVEVFNVSAVGELIFEKTIKNTVFQGAVDVHVVGYDQFYVVIGAKATSALDRLLSMAGFTHKSQLFYIDRSQVQLVVADQGLLTAVSGSSDAATIYVSNAKNRSLDSYQRDLLSGSLTLKQQLALGGAPEQINRAADDSLWLVTSPKPFDLVRHLWGKGVKSSPSEVVKVSNEGGQLMARSAMLSLGFDQSATSVAIQYRTARGENMLLGSITARNLLNCSP